MLKPHDSKAVVKVEKLVPRPFWPVLRPQKYERAGRAQGWARAFWMSLTRPLLSGLVMLE